MTVQTRVRTHLSKPIEGTAPRVNPNVITDSDWVPNDVSIRFIDCSKRTTLARGWGVGLLIGGEAECGIGWEQGDMGILCTFCSILLRASKTVYWKNQKVWLHHPHTFHGATVGGS